MEFDALADIPWIDTTLGLMTPQEALLRCHEEDVFLNLNRPAFEVSSQFRLLSHVTAVALRHEERSVITNPSAVHSLVATGLSPDAISKAMSDLSKGTDLFDSTFPFMQRPALPPKSAKDTGRALGPGQQEVKKLSPAMPSDEGEDYWNLMVKFPSTLSLEEAALKLATYHFFSMAGNNKYDGDKTRMGAPGIRFLGKGNAATEAIWVYDEGSLLHSLLSAIPREWIHGDGLPAWADRAAQVSKNVRGEFHPLWQASWGSNTAAVHWENERMTGVRVGGIPPEWMALPPINKEAEQKIKDWWDTRNYKDPLYLYLEQKDGAPKAQRIDFGRDGTDLAVEWAAERKIEALKNRAASNVLPVDEDARPLFLRHQIEGTASSPSIRSSQPFMADNSLWGFDLTSRDQMKISLNAAFIQRIHRITTGPFRRRNAGDAKREASGFGAVVLDPLENVRADASTLFWRNVTNTYETYIESARKGEPDAERLYNGVKVAALSTYDTVTRPFLGQYPAEIYFVRSAISGHIRSEISKARESGTAELTQERHTND